MKSIVKIFLMCVVLFVSSYTAYAQIPDSRGRDFWFTFLPNFHNNIDETATDSVLILQHQLYVYIGSEVPTTGTITITDSSGSVYNYPFTITDPSKLYEFKTFYGPFELQGWNNGGKVSFGGRQNEVAANQSFHVVSSEDVSVYALTQADLTSDAFMVLPTDALGVDYVVMSYKSDFKDTANSNTPSQFAIVATENNTSVTIVPTAKTMYIDSGAVRTVNLNKGESFLVQTNPSPPVPMSDLSGTLVRSDKPIALFGGHERATIPVELNNVLISRDCVVEQMTPIGTWGKSAYITPFVKSSDELDIGTNLYRVGAAFDSTEIYVDGAFVQMINASEYYEAPLTIASEIITSKPTQVATFKKTTSQPSQGNSGSRFGDPFMMLVPPAEQFMKSYRFISIQAYRFVRDFTGRIQVDGPVYLEQYLNVVIPSTSISTLVIDGVPVPASRFIPIGTTKFSYAQLVMKDGVHSISADTLFGIYVYGYGSANSYGYIGGMAFRPLDVYPPRALGKANCGTFTGSITDSLLGDSRVRSVDVVPGSDENVVFTMGAFSPPQAVVPISVGLVDVYMDGRISILATDNVLQKATIGLDLAGFTLSVQGKNSSRVLEDKKIILPVGRESCDTIVIENYGRHPQRITQFSSQRGARITEPPLPITFSPGKKIELVICRSEANRGIFEDTISIGDTCRQRSIVSYYVDARNDDEGPVVNATLDPCSTEVTVLVSDIRPFDFGLKASAVKTDVLVNCVVDADTSDNRIHRYTVKVTDPFYDAIYGFYSVDSANNITDVVDTLQGFTLSLDGVAEAFGSRQVPTVDLGTYQCAKIMVKNYGLLPFVISNIYVRQNIRFSLPQNQLTITLQPGETAPITVCYEPIAVVETPDLDTLEFAFGCNTKRIELAGYGSSVTYQGASKCDVPIGMAVNQTKARALAIPTPTDGNVVFVLESESREMTIKISDLSGSVVRNVSFKGNATRSVRVDLTNLPKGTYMCLIVHDNGVATTPLIIQ
ncbi:MAG: T9SS type A sorting domain-containing protein [Ignavibacteria bacterium]|nr:T9SS type A sorting domain-containing protein [Ignavibacteria bacterium]